MAGVVLSSVGLAGAFDQANVLVLYNTASADGQSIADHYKAVYPKVRVVGLDLPTGEEVSAADYLSIVRPSILPLLTSSTDCIVTTKGMPLRIVNPVQTSYPLSYRMNWNTYSSLESELTRIDTPNLTAALMGYQPAGGNAMVANPYDLRSPTKTKVAFSYTQFGSRLTSRLDGFTASDVNNAIDRASFAVKDLTAQRFVLDDDPAGLRTTSDRMSYSKTELEGRGLAGSAVYDNTSTFLTTTDGPALMYASHGTYGNGAPAAPPSTPSYIQTQLRFPIANGAFFQSYESYNAYSFNAGGNRTGANGPQGLLAEWIAAGGSAGVGHVEEPKPATTAEEDQILRMMLSGYSWAEAAWSAMPQLSYVNTVVGDPLMRWVDQPAVGDINIDGRIDLQDFGLIKDNFGRDHAVWRQGDLNGDACVDSQDFSLVKSHFGTLPFPGAAVPEPMTLIVLAAGLPLLLRRRT